MDALDKALADVRALVASQEAIIAELKTALAEQEARNGEHEKNLATFETSLSNEKKKTARLHNALVARGLTEEGLLTFLEPVVPMVPSVPTPRPKRTNPNHRGPTTWNDEVLLVFKELAEGRGVIYDKCKNHKDFLKQTKLKGLNRLHAMAEASARRKRAGLSPPSASDLNAEEEEDEEREVLAYSDEARDLALELASAGGGGGGGGGNE